ncbi:putative protein isoform X3 [Capsicum galapagoense]
MAGGDKDKGTANAPKKKLKKASMINRRSTGIHLRSDSILSHPPRGAPPAYTQQPPYTPTMRPTSGHATSHANSQLPHVMQQQTSSASYTVTLNPGNVLPSSVSTPQIGISSLPLRGNISEPKIPTIDLSITHGQVRPQAGMRDMHNRLIIESDGYGFNLYSAVRILSQIIQDLYSGAVMSWAKMPNNLRNQILLEFRRKCFWHPEHEAQIKVNFKLKAGCILTGLLSKAQEKIRGLGGFFLKIGKS